MTYSQAEAWFGRLKQSLRKRLGMEVEKKPIHDEQTIAAFSKSDPDTKMKVLGPQLNIYTSAISEKSKLLPSIATLSATLLVVTTLNHNLVPLQPFETKIILTIFLVLIPLTLHYYIKLMERTAQKAIDIIDSYQGFKVSEKVGPITFFQQLSSDTPIIIVYIFCFVIGLIIISVWLG